MCVAGQILDENGIPAISYGKFPNLFDVLIEQIGLKGFFLKMQSRKNQDEKYKVIDIMEIPFVIGCNMFIRKRVLDEIGLFNEKFFLNFEETELSWRAKKKQFRT